jgi:hypothetical protein
MAGMEVLGRNANVIPVASGQPFKMREASSALVVVTGTTTTSVSISEAAGFAGTPQSLACIKNIYWSSASNGTAAWNKVTFVPGVVVAGVYPTGIPSQTFLFSALNTFTGGVAAMVAFTLFTAELSDPFNYLIVTMGGAGGVVCSVILSDLVHQRGPANMAVLAA